MKPETKKKQTEKSVKKAPKAKMSPINEINKSIEKKFKDIAGKISIRHLWDFGGVHRFRINWWDELGIRESKFIHVSGKKRFKIKERK